MAPRHLVKHYSGCFCEYVFWMKITFWGKQVALHNVGGPHSVSQSKAFMDKDWPPPRKKEFSLQFVRLDGSISFSMGPQPDGPSERFGLASKATWANSLLYIYVCVCVCAHNFFSIQTCTHPISSFLWRTLTNACMNWNVKTSLGILTSLHKLLHFSLSILAPGELKIPKFLPGELDFQSIICLLYSCQFAYRELQAAR